MENKINILAFSLIICLLVILLGINLNNSSKKVLVVSNFNDCIMAGFPVLESNPRQCRTSNGVIFEEVTNNLNPSDNNVFCPADAKQCPNGTYVGRDSKNNCEFSPCAAN